MWHLYLAGDLPPTSLTTLHNIHPPVCNPWLLARRTLYMVAAPISCQPQFNAEGAWVSESVIWTRIPHILHPPTPTLLSNICQSLTVIRNPMYSNTKDPNLYRSLLPKGTSICMAGAESVTCLYLSVNYEISLIKIDKFSTSSNNILTEFMRNYQNRLFWDIYYTCQNEIRIVDSSFHHLVNYF